MVIISLIKSLLKDSDIRFMVLDENMSILEGSIGMIPRRIMVVSESAVSARRLMKDAGLQKYLKNDSPTGGE